MLTNYSIQKLQDYFDNRGRAPTSTTPTFNSVEHERDFYRDEYQALQSVNQAQSKAILELNVEIKSLKATLNPTPDVPWYKDLF